MKGAQEVCGSMKGCLNFRHELSIETLPRGLWGLQLREAVLLPPPPPPDLNSDCGGPSTIVGCPCPHSSPIHSSQAPQYRDVPLQAEGTLLRCEKTDPASLDAGDFKPPTC